MATLTPILVGIAQTGVPLIPPVITSFALINADTDTEISTLIPGMVVNLAALPTKNINIRAKTNHEAFGSINFILSGAQSRDVNSNTPPYSLYGGSGNNYNAWTPVAGSYTLKSIPYSGGNLSGGVGVLFQISFIVEDTVVTDTTPTLAFISQLPTYDRGSGTVVRVTEPIQQDYFDWSLSLPTGITVDNIQTFNALNGGFWTRRTLFIDPIFYASWINTTSTADSAPAWKTIIAAAVKYKKHINNRDHYVSYWYEANTPIEILPDGVEIHGRGLIKCYITATPPAITKPEWYPRPAPPPSSATQAEKDAYNAIVNDPAYQDFLAKGATYYDVGKSYQLLSWKGNNGVCYSRFDGGKDNSKINQHQQTSSANGIVVSGNGFKWYGNVYNFQTRGIRWTGDNFYAHSLEVNKNSAYTPFNFSSVKDIDLISFGELHFERETQDPYAWPKVVAFNGSVNESTLTPKYVIKKIKGSKIVCKNGNILLEAAVGTAVGAGVKVFLEFNVDEIYCSVDTFHITSNAEANISKFQNLVDAIGKQWQFNAYHNRISGPYFNETYNIDLTGDLDANGKPTGFYKTNTFMMKMPYDSFVVGKFWYVRRNGYTRGSGRMCNGAPDLIKIDELIIDDGDHWMNSITREGVALTHSDAEKRKQSTFFIFDMGSSTHIYINKITYIGSKNNIYRLQDGGSSAVSRVHFPAGYTPPSNILLY